MDDPGLAEELLGAEEWTAEQPHLEVRGQGPAGLVVGLARAGEEREGHDDEEEQARHGVRVSRAAGPLSVPRAGRLARK